MVITTTALKKTLERLEQEVETLRRLIEQLEADDEQRQEQQNCEKKHRQKRLDARRRAQEWAKRTFK